LVHYGSFDFKYSPKNVFVKGYEIKREKRSEGSGVIYLEVKFENKTAIGSISYSKIGDGIYIQSSK
jgi:hypothetical protein